MFKNIQHRIIKAATRQFSFSCIKPQSSSKLHSIPLSDLEIRNPLPTDIVDVTRACFEIWEGTCPHPDNFLKLLKNKRVLHKVVYHKPSKRVIISNMATLTRCPSLPSSHWAESPNADYSGSYPCPRPAVSEEGYEYCANSSYVHPDYRAAHVAPWSFKNMIVEDYKALGKLPLRYIYTSHDDVYALGGVNVGPHGGPDSTCIAASNFLSYECSFKKLDEITRIAEKMKFIGRFSEHHPYKPFQGQIDQRETEKRLESLLMIGKGLEEIPFEEVYSKLMGSPYLKELLWAGRYLPTDMSPIPFHPSNFSKDQNPYDALVLVGRAPPQSKSGISAALNSNATAPVSSISSTCTFWMPAGVCLSQYSTALTIEDTLAHMVRALSEIRKRLEQAQRSRPLETYPSSFLTAKELSALPKGLVLSPAQKIDKFLLAFFFNNKCSRHIVDQAMRTLLGMKTKIILGGHVPKRLHLIRTTVGHPIYP